MPEMMPPPSAPPQDDQAQPGLEDIVNTVHEALLKLSQTSPAFKDALAAFEGAVADMAGGPKPMPQGSSMEAGSADVKPAM